MIGRRMKKIGVVVGPLAVLLTVAVAPAARAAIAAPGGCRPGARTLSAPGDRVYPDTGNGGYVSVHTDVDVEYQATANTFLPGTHVVLTDRATQCLSGFSLDLERHSVDAVTGPDLAVQSVLVDGRPAAFRFAQPTYPGDPKGADDPDPRAHQASQHDPVGGPARNPLPPACSPQLTATDPDGDDGTPCAADKLVVTPRQPIARGAAFTVTVAYTGRPGLHTDGDGSTEGWFRAKGGGFVTTEPVGTEDWMPLNDHPTAKPTYDVYDTVEAGRTAVANGVLLGTVRHPATARFPAGSVTWHWRSEAPVASYLVENSIGRYAISERTTASGVRYYEVQDRSIPAVQQAKNLVIMDKQQDITAFQSQLNGPFPFASDGVVVGTPPASFEEEMQTMITFAGGQIGLSTFYHENMHQWWGDNVTEGSYAMTFYKEGLATLGQYFLAARQAQSAAGGPDSAAGRAAFEQTLVTAFDNTYAQTGPFWSGAPSDPTAASLFAGSSTYARPGAAYIALRQILGPTAFAQTLQGLQRTYGGGSITEPELEAAFTTGLADPSCTGRLHQFFGQWFDTSYAGHGKPTITGPGLRGAGFFAGSCHR